jgi:hypothetical protein
MLWMLHGKIFDIFDEFFVYRIMRNFGKDDEKK